MSRFGWRVWTRMKSAAPDKITSSDYSLIMGIAHAVGNYEEVVYLFEDLEFNTSTPVSARNLADVMRALVKLKDYRMAKRKFLKYGLSPSYDRLSPLPVASYLESLCASTNLAQARALLKGT